MINRRAFLAITAALPFTRALPSTPVLPTKTGGPLKFTDLDDFVMLICLQYNQGKWREVSGVHPDQEPYGIKYWLKDKVTPLSGSGK